MTPIRREADATPRQKAAVLVLGTVASWLLLLLVVWIAVTTFDRAY